MITFRESIKNESPKSNKSPKRFQTNKILKRSLGGDFIIFLKIFADTILSQTWIFFFLVLLFLLRFPYDWHINYYIKKEERERERETPAKRGYQWIGRSINRQKKAKKKNTKLMMREPEREKYHLLPETPGARKYPDNITKF